MKTIRHTTNCPGNSGDWKGRHARAVESGLRNVHGTRGIFQADSLVQAINAWCDYASGHKRKFESEIGEDYILAPMWFAWGIALRGLLNGETGQLDCGTLDAIIYDNLTEQGWVE
jgi:hypothetical protein